MTGAIHEGDEDAHLFCIGFVESELRVWPYDRERETVKEGAKECARRAF